MFIEHICMILKYRDHEILQKAHCPLCWILSMSIYDLVLVNVCHFHHHFLIQYWLLNFELYRDARGYILNLTSTNSKKGGP